MYSSEILHRIRAYTCPAFVSFRQHNDEMIGRVSGRGSLSSAPRGVRTPRHDIFEVVYKEDI